MNDEPDRSSDFHDSVFIEGHIIAEKIADGSMLNDSSVCEVGDLDCTPQPDWPDELSYTESKEKEFQKCDTDIVFKTMDKMLPQYVKENLEIKLKPSRANSNSSDENDNNMNEDTHSKHSGEHSISELLYNISDVQHEPKNTSIIRKDPKEILENLSELLNCTNPSEKQKSEGQNLLTSLADMLCKSKSSTTNNLDDSGRSINDKHSNSSNKDHECFEVSDLETKNAKESVCRKNETSDLSLKSKPIESLKDKRISRSFGLSSQDKILSDAGKKMSATSLDINKNNSTNSSVNSSSGKNSNLPKPYIAGKLRQKNFSSTLKRGPMKAVISVGEMKMRKDTPATPEKRELQSMQSKSTSTPKNEPKLKPKAASTPTTHLKDTPRSLKNPKKSADSSLVKSNLLNSSSKSTGLLRHSMINMGYRQRTNSVSDIKKPNEVLRRSNSIEKESGIMSSVARVRQNLGLSYYQPLKQSSVVENEPLVENKGKLGKNRQSPVAKSNNVELKCTFNKNKLCEMQNMDNLIPSAEIIPSFQQKKINVSTSSRSQINTTPGLHIEKRNRMQRFIQSKDSKGKVNRRNSTGSESGIKSCLAQIRQNLLGSPCFNLKKDDVLKRNYTVLSENRGLDKISIIKWL